MTMADFVAFVDQIDFFSKSHLQKVNWGVGVKVSTLIRTVFHTSARRHLNTFRIFSDRIFMEGLLNTNISNCFIFKKSSTKSELRDSVFDA